MVKDAEEIKKKRANKNVSPSYWVEGIGELSNQFAEELRLMDEFKLLWELFAKSCTISGNNPQSFTHT